MRPQRPRPLTADDDVTHFDSGETSLDRYLRGRALTNHLTGIARCYVCVDADTSRVVGYYTLSAVAVEHAALPGRAGRNAPDPVPAVLLGRLAVHAAAQGAGLGRHLVRDAVLSTLAAADRIGVRILLVHALHERAAEFYRALGFRLSPSDPLHLHLLLSDARASTTTGPAPTTVAAPPRWRTWDQVTAAVTGPSDTAWPSDQALIDQSVHDPYDRCPPKGLTT